MTGGGSRNKMNAERSRFAKVRSQAATSCCILDIGTRSTYHDDVNQSDVHTRHTDTSYWSLTAPNVTGPGAHIKTPHLF